MKCLLPIMLIAMLLAGCVPGGVAESDAEMATRVAQILTEISPPEELAPEPPLFQETTPPVVEVTLAPPTETPEPKETETPTETLLEETTAPTVVATADGSPTPPATLTQPAQPTVTAPASDPRLTLGQPTSTDNMEKAQTWNWSTGSDQFTTALLQDGSFNLTGLTTTAGWRLPALEATSNIYIEMTMRPATCSGRDNYGIIFRIPVRHQADQGYLFGVSCDGQYNLWKWDGKEQPDGKAATLVYWKKNDAIQTGANQTNRLGVLAVGDRITLYVNGVKLEEVRDTSYSSGHFGIFVSARVTDEFTVRVDEANYWLNPKP